MSLLRKFSFTLALMMICFTVSQAQKKTRVHYIDVGQGESILLEFENSAVLIDAGGELTCEINGPVTTYLDKFFKDQRPDLQKTIHTIIISHPHIDHTMWLLQVMERYKVLNLIDGGNDEGSGRVPLFAARWFAANHNINYFPVKNVDVVKAGFVNPALQSIQKENPGVELRFLSASRGCEDANNDSLALLLVYRAAKFLFTGDAEADDPDEPETKCGGAEITYLLDHFKNDGSLDIDVYKVGHHGSHNGTTEAFIKAMSPKISVISAGRPVQDLPCRFHAFQFGHPRETTVQSLERESKRDRDTPPPLPVKVTTMDRPATRRERDLRRAIYCTCWDGNIIVEPIQDGKDFKVLLRQ